MAQRYKDLKGQRFGRLTVECLNGVNKHGTKIWLCKCDCGNKTTASCSSLTSNKVQSCGCLRNEKISKVTYSHGGTHTRLYAILNGMKGRCKDVRNPAYKYYGGKGVSICNEWLNFSNFREWALSNGYSDNLTIDRIDPNGNYEPSNCRWIPNKEQQNNKRADKDFNYNGETKTIKQWLKQFYFKCNDYYRLLRIGLTNKQVLDFISSEDTLKLQESRKDIVGERYTIEKGNKRLFDKFLNKFVSLADFN